MSVLSPDFLEFSAARARRVLVVAGLIATLAGCGATRAAESDRIAELLGVTPGMTVADVGAGRGSYAFRLAEQVGESGHVFATEVDEDDVASIERRISSDELTNLTAVLGTDVATGLDDGCCDAILLRLVYHHFTQPEPMRRSLMAALKPGGLIAVIDIEPQSTWSELAGVPDRGGHGIPPDDLVAEMIGGGFEFVERIDDWPGDDDHFCVLFRRPDHQATP